MFMIQLTIQKNIQFSFHDMMYKIHTSSLDVPEMIKWAKIAFYQLQEKEIQECSDICIIESRSSYPINRKLENSYFINISCTK